MDVTCDLPQHCGDLSSKYIGLEPKTTRKISACAVIGINVLGDILRHFEECSEDMILG